MHQPKSSILLFNIIILFICEIYTNMLKQLVNKQKFHKKKIYITYKFVYTVSYFSSHFTTFIFMNMNLHLTMFYILGFTFFNLRMLIFCCQMTPFLQFRKFIFTKNCIIQYLWNVAHHARIFSQNCSLPIYRSPITNDKLGKSIPACAISNI